MPKYRMIHVDHYMCKPVIPFDDLKSEATGENVSRVPVIRIFGVDADGHKICIHVHGFYPYVAIQNKEPENSEHGKEVVEDIKRAVDELARSNRKNQHQPAPNGASLAHLTADQRSPVHRIDRVKSFNYYGYHKNEEDFFKLYLYNPSMVKQLAQLFENYKVLGRFVPVFWAHLPYVLLFFIDNNLRGMQFIEIDQLFWRKDKSPSSQTIPQGTYSPLAGASKGVSNNQQRRVDTEEIENFTTDIEAISSCELEADIRFEWILNRQRFGKGNDDALKELWLDDQEPIHTSSFIDSKLPLFNLERDYIEQLCRLCEVDRDILRLNTIERPNRLVSRASSTDFSDSDNSVDTLLDREELEQSYPLPAQSCEIEDEFSDDDQFVLAAIIKAESQNPILRSQSETNFQPESHSKQEGSLNTSRSSSLSTLRPITQTTGEPVNGGKGKRRFSDNSMIDGRSVLSSSANVDKSESQHSSTSSRVSHEYQYLCLMSMELHISTRGQLRPDPASDPIEAVFYCIRNDVPENSNKPSQVIGMIITDPFSLNDQLPRESTDANRIRSPSARSNMSFVQKMRTLLHKTGLTMKDIELNIVDTELELIITLVEVVKTYDPEILIGYEMERLSWGYILERSSALNVSISGALSRVVDSSLGSNSNYVESAFVQPIVLTGRMVFSTWRMIRHEVKLNTCSYERIHQHALNERVPCFAFETLTKWFNNNLNRWRVIDYYIVRVIGQMRILDKFDLVAKVSEMARVYGTQFIDVITRGSQIGIESMMLRLANLQNLTPLSPTVTQRNQMKPPGALPLVMEPERNIYYDPVAVLDFQSLYPSVVIAYNYCYSTCLGRVSDLEKNEPHQFGCSQLFVEKEEVKRLLLSNSIHVSPCGVAFVKKNVRHGVLPKMLSELIATRAMVKDQMKKNMKSGRPNRRLQKILDHRQHGLKMMANTTYGYTGATHTGRMACIEIADSIVSKGKEILENAIELVESLLGARAKVVYGDTDSIFIQFINCDRETSFKLAYEMVDAITKANPYPIKMKFEKIYQPCVLQTKKRYCGFKYETPEQTRPEFEAKGNETIRRDCCAAAARMLEMTLRLQFETRDIQQVKSYVQHQFVKIMSGKLSNIQDFIFARQYRPRDIDKTESVYVPAWQITKRLLASDPRAEPRFKERIPFVIVYGEPRTPLVNLAKTPIEVLENLSYRINADYYIQKIICPTLNRIFCHLRVDTLDWYKSMPHQNLVHRSHYLAAQKNQYASSAAHKQSTMSQYFSPSHCPVCAKSIPVSDEVCIRCREDLQSSVVRLTEEISRNNRKLFAYHQLCRACSSLERSNNADDDHTNPCISYDCENLFRYHQARLDVMNSNFLSKLLKNLN